MSERRFNEEEVAAIFERAAQTQQSGQRQLPSGEGMTLAELQEIGREVGISPELVADAAGALDRQGRATSRRFLGLEIGVGYTVDLGRRLSDEEWERLVVELRETFDARGRVRADGSLRQWTNGNLQALLEPTAGGHRVRMRTMKGNAIGWMTGGAAMMGLAIIPAIASAMGSSSGGLGAVAQLLAIGAGMFVIGAVQLPRWAQRRREQMQQIAARLTAIAPEQAPSADGAPRR